MADPIVNPNTNPTEPAAEPNPGTEGRTFTSEYVSALRSESAGYRTRAKTAEGALRKVLGLGDNDDLNDIDNKINAFNQRQADAVSAASAKTTALIIDNAINNLDGYDTKLLSKLIDRKNISIDDNGNVTGLNEAVAAVEAEFPSIKKVNVPKYTRGTTENPKATETTKDRANDAFRSFFGHSKT